MAIQSQTKTFTTSDPYLDITWVDQYTNFVNLYGVSTTDGSTVAIRLTNPSNTALPPTNASVRIEPSAPFDGAVTVTNIEVLP
jgi:hypothetical protein